MIDRISSSPRAEASCPQGYRLFKHFPMPQPSIASQIYLLPKDGPETELGLSRSQLRTAREWSWTMSAGYVADTFCRQARCICLGSNDRLYSLIHKVPLASAVRTREIQPQTICWDLMPATRRRARNGKAPFTIGKAKLMFRTTGRSHLV